VDVEVKDLGVTFGSVQALQSVDLKIRGGEILSIIGPSGCGKSTLLHSIGGLTPSTRGSVHLDGELVTGPVPAKAAFVFQDFSLLPWHRAVDNVALGLEFSRRPKRQRRQKALDMLQLVGLAHRADAYPRELSGGMQQRVAVARALAMDPQVLLLDEPFGALDEITRRNLGIEISHLLTAANQTVVLVTHSLDEAIFWADRIIVMGGPPGHVVDEIVVPAPRPRAYDFLSEGIFESLRARLFDLLRAPSEALTAGASKVSRPDAGSLGDGPKVR
jgi:NitT/TauT family transport system ATP-binding protein